MAPRVNPMFGCHAVYVEEKIVLILRERESAPESNGVWLCTTVEHHDSLRAEFPSLTSISVLSDGVTGWQLLPATAPDFEESVFRVCELILSGDSRIGKVPKAKRVAVSKKKKSAGHKKTKKTKTSKTAKKIRKSSRKKSKKK